MDGNDLAVRLGDEALGDVAVVFDTAAEMSEKRLRVAAWIQGWLYRATLLLEVDGELRHSGAPPAAPLTAEPRLSMACGVSSARALVTVMASASQTVA